jgi:uncharacterized damage-inducible protein DinB
MSTSNEKPRSNEKSQWNKETANKETANERPASKPETWLRGPIAGVPDLVMPAAHAFLQTAEEVAAIAPSLTPDELWQRPGGVASPGFHLKHLVGATDRLLTYARGESLTSAQIAVLKAEKDPGTPPETASDLVATVQQAIAHALDQLRHTPVESLTDKRTVGRAALPTTVLGLLFHAAEHAQRHAGQLTTTIKVLRAGP